MPFEAEEKAFYTYRSIVKSTRDLAPSLFRTTWNEYRLGQPWRNVSTLGAMDIIKVKIYSSHGSVSYLIHRISQATP